MSFCSEKSRAKLPALYKFYYRNSINFFYICKSVLILGTIILRQGPKFPYYTLPSFMYGELTAGRTCT